MDFSKLLSQIFVFILSLYIVIGTASGAHAADEFPTSRKIVLAFDRTALVERQPWGGVTFQNMGDRVKLTATKNYPVVVYDAERAAEIARLEAKAVSKPIISPSTTQMLKSVGRGVGVQLVAIGVYQLLGKAVDYVLDPANNKLQYKERIGGQCALTSGAAYTTSFDDAMKSRCNSMPYAYKLFTKDTANPVGYEYKCGTTDNNFTYRDSIIYCQTKQDEVTKELPLTEVLQASKDVAANPQKQNSQSAQDGIKTVVQDMITNNEIDNSVYNENISEDNSTDIINNFVTNNYPNTNLGFTTQNGQTTPNAGTQVTNNGTTTNYTTNNTTTNNDNSKTTTTTTTTVNNTTQNITNISITNNTTNVAAPPTTDTNNPTSSTPATSAPAATSSPAKTEQPTSATAPTKPFELPAFCDWAKPVCDFIDWFKKEPDEPKDDPVEIQNKDRPDFNLDDYSYKPYIEFPAQCPPAPSFQVFGATLSFPMHLFCDFASQMSYIILAYAWLRGLVIVGSTLK